MPPDPVAPSPQASAARYRAALRCATLRRERRPGFTLLDRWSWHLPRAVLAFLASFAALAGAATAPASPASAPVTPTLCLTPPETPEPVVVIVSTTAILVGEDPAPVVPLPARAELVESGVAAKYKRTGPNDMLVVPLQQAIERARDASLARRGPTGGDGPVEAVLVADATTPFRLLVEVLFTLGQSGVGKYHLMVRARKK